MHAHFNLMIELQEDLVKTNIGFLVHRLYTLMKFLNKLFLLGKYKVGAA